MATTTPNFGWPVPTSTDLVKDGAVAIEGLGDAIDASLLDLKGGTTNQVLAKNSNTDMDFKWVADASGIPATILDAKGDLIAATAADTAARLAVGTNGQVLTADSAEATGLKWTTPSSGTPAFVGVSAFDSLEAGQNISNATYTALTYNSENYDTDGFHSTSTNTSRLTIPTGKGGKYLITTFVNWDNSAGGYRIAVIYLNGTYNKAVGIETSGGYLGQNCSYTMTLAAGDYIETYVYQNSGGTRNCNENKYFQATYLGA